MRLSGPSSALLLEKSDPYCKYLTNISIGVRHRAGSRNEIRWSPFIEGLRIAWMLADRTITGSYEMKPLYWRSENSMDAGPPNYHRVVWNETKWMRWVWRNGGMKFVPGENEKNQPRLRFVHHEIHMEWPRRELGTPAVRGERLTACTRRSPWKYN